MSAVTTAHGFKVGDLVYRGKRDLSGGAIVWRIVSIYQATDDKFYAVLTSGMTDRGATVPVEKLSKFIPRLTEPAP